MLRPERLRLRQFKPKSYVAMIHIAGKANSKLLFTAPRQWPPTFLGLPFVTDIRRRRTAWQDEVVEAAPSSFVFGQRPF